MFLSKYMKYISLTIPLTKALCSNKQAQLDFLYWSSFFHVGLSNLTAREMKAWSHLITKL